MLHWKKTWSSECKSKTFTITISKKWYCSERSGFNQASSVKYKGLSTDIFYFSARDIDFENRKLLQRQTDYDMMTASGGVCGVLAGRQICARVRMLCWCYANCEKLELSHIFKYIIFMGTTTVRSFLPLFSDRLG